MKKIYIIYLKDGKSVKVLTTTKRKWYKDFSANVKTDVYQVRDTMEKATRTFFEMNASLNKERMKKKWMR